jgi:hypothetical protein
MYNTCIDTEWEFPQRREEIVIVGHYAKATLDIFFGLSLSSLAARLAGRMDVGATCSPG